jgi:hypothetical protein
MRDSKPRMSGAWINAFGSPRWLTACLAGVARKDVAGAGFMAHPVPTRALAARFGHLSVNLSRVPWPGALDPGPSDG